MKTIMRIVFTISLLLLASCGKIDTNDVKRSVQEDLPGAEIISVNGRFVPSLKGLLRLAVNVEIHYKEKDSTESKTITWYYENNNGWYLFAKKPFSEISQEEYSQILAKQK